MTTIFPMLVYIMFLHAGLIDPAAICTYTTIPVNGFQAAAMECYVPDPALEEEAPKDEKAIKGSPRPTRSR